MTVGGNGEDRAHGRRVTLIFAGCAGKRNGCVALILGLTVASVPALAPGAALAVSHDRPLAHPVLLGVGATWTESGSYQRLVHPGAILELDLALGRNVAIGLFGDITHIDDRLYGRRNRLLTGPNLKLLPLRSGTVRPWVTVGAAMSLVDDTGYGFGVGAGAFFLPDSPAALFLEVRTYHIADFENPAYDQVVLRAGAAF